jgi:hypothetical protein
VLQDGRSRVLIPIKSYYSSVYPILPSEVDLASNKNEYLEFSRRVKGWSVEDNSSAICKPIV